MFKKGQLVKCIEDSPYGTTIPAGTICKVIGKTAKGSLLIEDPSDLNWPWRLPECYVTLPTQSEKKDLSLQYKGTKS